MAYIGQSNSLYDPTRVTPTTVQTFNGDGVTTQFTLQLPVTNSADIEVLVENVVQQPDYAYTAIGNTLTFTSAPPVGTNNIYVRFGKVTGLTGTVPDGSVTSSKLANNIRLLATDMYTGTGSQTAFNLSDTPADANSLIVTVNGVGQAAPSNYTVSGSTITFTSAPASGANVVIRNVGFRTTQTLYAFPSGTQMVQPVITGGSANNMTLTNATITNSTANNLTLNNANINGGSANGIMYVNSSNTVTSGSGLVFDGTNVGIGTNSPATKLHVSGTGSTPTLFERTGSNGVYLQLKDASGSSVFLGASNGVFAVQTPGSSYSDKLVVDSSGNLGLGVTPSAWRTDVSFKALQMPGGTFAAYVAGGLDPTPNISANAYVDSGGTWRYINSRAASWYIQNGGAHAWYNAPSGTAGNAISFTQSMTLDASGNLLVGKTASSQTSGEGVQLSPTTAAVNSYMAIVSPNSLTGTNIISAYSTGATTFRFYVQWDGKIYATSTSITAISDISLKKNIRPLETGLAEVLALKPRRFDWKNGDGNNVAGFIAQEVETVLPDLVSDYKYNEEETKRGLKMGDMIPTMVKAIQELSAELNELKAKVNA